MRINKLLIICMLFLVSLISVYANPTGNNVVISEVLYNANGSSEGGKEWIEIYNPTANTINIGSWSIFKESNPLPIVTFPSGTTIASYKHLLIGDDGTLPSNLPTPDFIGSVSTLYNTGDGVALKNNLGQIVDAVGWATVSNPNFYEGIKISSVPDGNSTERKLGSPCGNAVDTDNNANDFLIQTKPKPQNSVNATEIPCGVTPDTIPPATISNLQLIAKTNESITWSWTNPSDPDFYQNIIYLNGINYANSSESTAYFYGLQNNTAYTITIHTKDFTGNVNNTNVSDTQTTLQNPPPQDTTAPTAIVNNVEGDTTQPYNSTNNETTVVVDLNEQGDCRMSDNDESYDNMVDNYDCSGDGTTQAACKHSWQSDGVYSVYIACKDLSNNKNSDLDNLKVDYTITTTIIEDLTPPTITNLNVNYITISSAYVYWNTNELSDSKVYYGKTILNNLINISTLILTHNIFLDNLEENTTYYYLIQSCDNSNNCANSTLNNFKTLERSPSEIIDDLQVNYIRGKVIIDGIIAPKGTKYKVEILSGNNVGSVYNGEVDDENIPTFLNNNGFFDTRDQIVFTTNSLFMITSENCTGNYTGGFLNGGNGDFSDENTLIKLNCGVFPVINDIYYQPIKPEEGETVFVFANVTDNIGVDKVFINYTVNNGNSNLTEMNLSSIYSINLGIFNANDIIKYSIIANDTNGNSVTSNLYLINISYIDTDDDGVIDIIDNCPTNANPDQSDVDNDGIGDVCDAYPNDHDNDGYSSDVDCNDNDITIYPGAIEIDDNIDQDCVNDAPTIVNLPNITIDEDTNYNLDLNNYVNDIDDVESNLLWSFSGNADIFISVNLNIATIEPKENWYGNEIINFTVKDPSGLSDSFVITITVNKLFDDIPIITAFNPETNPIVGDNIPQDFSITISDPDEFNPLINWYVNDNLESSGNTLFSWIDTKNYTLKVNLTNSTSEKIWNVYVTKIPITTYNGTINQINESNVNAFDCLIIENSYGKIDFCGQIINLSDVVDVNRYVKLQKGIIGIDTNAYGFNVFQDKQAKITMYNVELTNPIKIYYNSGFNATGTTLCQDSICSNINYDALTKTLTFNVTGFSVFFLGNRAPVAKITLPADMSSYTYGTPVTFIGSATDIEDGTLTGNNLQWSSSAIGNIGSGGSFTINNLLITTHTITLTATDSNGETGTFSITIMINPSQYQSESQTESSTSNGQGADGDEDDKNHDLKINKVEIMPTAINCGDTINLKTEIENTGDYNEKDIYIKTKNDVLGIDEKSSEIDINKNDEKNLYLSLYISKNAKENKYTLQIKAYLEDNELVDTTQQTINVICEKNNVNKISTEISSSNNNKIIEKSNIENPNLENLKKSTFISAILLIILLLILLLIYLFKRIK